MEVTPDKLADLRVKHLELASSSISRMAGYSADIKGYCVTIVSAVIGFSITLKSSTLLLSAILPVLVLPILDAQYLKVEKRFRKVYEEVRNGSWQEITDFSMNPKMDTSPSIFRMLLNWSVVWFYVLMLLLILVSYVFLRHTHG